VAWVNCRSNIASAATSSRSVRAGAGRSTFSWRQRARRAARSRSRDRAAGFADIRTVNLAVHLPVADPQTCWDFHMSHGFAARVEALDPADAAEFQRRALAELTRMHESGGIVLDRGAVAYLATVPVNDPSEPGSQS
jgi:hypothetical protein